MLYKLGRYLLLFVISVDTLKLSNKDRLFINMVNENINKISKYDLPKNNYESVKLNAGAPSRNYGSFDFIIVGAGAAGSILANRLSEINNWSILLLEAGGEETEFSNIPGMAVYLPSSEMGWGYYSVPQHTCCLGMKNNSCIAPRGKVIGGSSTINSKIYTRGNRYDFNEWAELGNLGWSYEEVLPYFKKSERAHFHSSYAGVHGELDVTYIEPTVFTKTYLKGMNELGLKTIDYNGANQIGASATQFMQNGNKALSAARAFLDPIRTIRSNLNITLNAFVVKILIDFDTKVAYGVEFIQKGEKYFAYVTNEVIISAGVFNTPQILMLSGIGPKRELERLSLEVGLDLPVGKHFQDHPQFIGLVVKTNQNVFDESEDKLLLKYLHNHRPYTACYNSDSVGFFDYKNKTCKVPSIQHSVTVSTGIDASKSFINLNDEFRRHYYKNYNRYSDIIIVVTLLHPKSRGDVTLKSNSVVDFPNINYNYFSDKRGEDIEVMYQGILKSLKLLDTAAFKAINASLAPVISGCDEYKKFSKKYWYCAIRNLASTAYHPVGTARMGPSPVDSVVSPDLMVHGMLNLRVVDSSIMPKVTSGNTCAPTYMIAEKASDIIKNYYGKLFKRK